MSKGASILPTRLVAPHKSYSSPLADQVKKAEELLRAGHVREAHGFLKPLVDKHPKHIEFLYCYAVCHRLLSQWEQAAKHLDSLLAISPKFGRAFQERGHLLRVLGRLNEANQSYRQAVEHNPALLSSWEGIRSTLPKNAPSDYRSHVEGQVNLLTSLPPTIRSVQSLRYEKKDYRAEQLCRAFLQKNPRHVEGMRQLALIAQDQGMLNDAEFLLESAIEFDPDSTAVRISYMDVLHKRQKFDKSLAEAERLLGAQPDIPLFRLAHAHQLNAIGEFERALTIYDDILKNHPNSTLASPRLHLSRGHALKTFGRTDDAIASYQNAYRARETFGDAYWSLANLKTYRFGDAELNQMMQLVGREDVEPEDRAHLHFALGKAFEDSEDFAKSFEHYTQGNQIRHKQTGYDSKVMTARMRLQRYVCTREFFDARRGVGSPAQDPIFIVGLPRAGSTLLEQILASHSQVDGTLELHHISTIAQQLDGRRREKDEPRYPGTLAHLKPETFKVIANRFLEETQVHRKQKPLFIDKMPNNFRHIGLIRLILPNAKIIDARREPMASCFSGYKQLFASGQEFTYGLRDIGSYYQDYVELMNHWDEVLPGFVLRVQYEDVVDDLETQVRRILDFCKLPFESACVNFHETKRAVRTPSAEQVRQPIYREGLEQWRNYETWLTPLREALGPALWSYR